MNDTFELTGTVYKILPQEKYSKVILKYLIGSREQHTPFTAMSQKTDEQVKNLQPGKPVKIEFQTGGKEANGKFFANNLIVNIIQ